VNVPPLKMRRWKRVEYERLVARGFFQPDERLELLDGLLVIREPQGSRHAAVVALVHEVLQHAFGRGYTRRDHSPVALDDTSEPEPDVIMVRGRPLDYLHGHPSTPLLIVEVAETSVARDRRKGGLYARAGIQEYWIVNLVDSVLEVYRQPAAAPPASYGAKYRSVRLLRRPAIVTSLAKPRARVRVASLLPPA
jgi:Uma2 family endonuclease